MTEHDRQDRTDAAEAPDATVPAPRGPVPDLGFFAGAPQPRDTGSFGGPAPSSPFGGPPPSPFDSPQTAPFGTAVATPFGAPAPALPGPPGQPGNSSTWKLLATGVVVAVLLVTVFGGRFAWKQFVADPVAPETFGGMARLGDDSDELLAGAQDQLTDELSAGSAATVALYSDGQGTGFMLFAVRGGSRPGSGGGEDPFAGWTESEQAGARCYSQPAQAAAGLGVTMCMRALWRRAVFVMGIGITAMDPAVVAQATEEAWDAQ